MKHAFLTLLALTIFAGCIPVAMLRTPQPVTSEEFTLGGTILANFGSDLPLSGGLYVAYAWGDGETEFNVSGQTGVRFGVKQRIADGLSLDLGATLAPFFFLIPNFTGLPVAADVGLIVGLDRFYVSPRVDWVAFGWPGLNLSFSGVIVQLVVGYAEPDWIAEAGGLLNPANGAVIFTVSAGRRF